MVGTGTCDSLHQTSSFIRTLEKTQGLKVSSPEEIAWRYGWISDDNLKEISKKYKNSNYGDYLPILMKKNKLKLIDFFKFCSKYSL